MSRKVGLLLAGGGILLTWLATRPALTVEQVQDGLRVLGQQVAR